MGWIWVKSLYLHKCFSFTYVFTAKITVWYCSNIFFKLCLKPIVQPGPAYGLLGFRCGDDVLVKLWFLVICVFLSSWWGHIWFHRLRGLLLVVGAFCTALWGEDHCVGLTNNKANMATAKVVVVAVNAHENNRQWKRDHGELKVWIQTKTNNLQQCWGSLRSL